MIREAIDKILELAHPNFTTLYDRDFSDRQLHLIKMPSENLAKPVVFRSLKGFCEFVNDNHEILDDEFVMVAGPHEVLFLDKLDDLNQRQNWAQAVWRSEPFKFGQYMLLEEFIVSLDTMFVPSAKIEDLKNLLGHIANENIKTHTDDGFSQSIQVKTGITTKAEVKIENPIRLRPYRTFLEVEQPEVPCLLRMRNRESSIQVALWAADGGQWELEAMDKIGNYLRSVLGTAEGSIKVLA